MSLDSLLHSEVDDLLRQAATELRRHLETDPEGRAETVLNAFPSLASDPERALKLIVLEFQLRRQMGQKPQPGDWYARFPQWSEQLRARLEEAPDGVNASEQETPALATSPYDDADRRTLVDVDVDVPILGRHEILEEIDRGGMGVVYRARDLVLDRVVALKVIRSGTLASADEVQRFYREARAAAQLRHPNIVPIYGMGLYEKQHCFTMALFSRGSLAQHLADYRRDVREAVRLLVKVARAVQAAHEQGIVHRDLKPGNILLDEHGGPIVSDFGLAKNLEVSTTLTLPAHPVGTPAYMAPEQARCEAATTASDIWSLGVILYELLTGRVPFPGNGVDEVKQKVLHADPISPRRFRPDFPRDLQTIIQTCLEKDPARRYPSAAALADDLECWRRGEPIHARPLSWPRWAWRRVRRHPWVTVALVFAGYVAVLAALMLSLRRTPDPDQPLREIQRQLKQGQAVTLIGHTGPPRWFRWGTKDIPGTSVAQETPFSISTADLGLVELLPDPVLTRHRFRAEVRHYDGSSEGIVGIYFAHGQHPTDKGVEHCHWEVTFNDLSYVKPINHLVALYCRQWTPNAVPPHNTTGSGKSKSFTPTVTRDDHESWRRLAVEMTPEKARILWENETLCEISGDDLSNPDMWWERRKSKGYRGPNLLAGASPGKALGLFVLKSIADFRNVVIEPLEDAN